MKEKSSSQTGTAEQFNLDHSHCTIENK